MTAEQTAAYCEGLMDCHLEQRLDGDTVHGAMLSVLGSVEEGQQDDTALDHWYSMVFLSSRNAR